MGAIDGLVVHGTSGSAEPASVHVSTVVAILIPGAVVPGGPIGVGDRLRQFMAGDA